MSPLRGGPLPTLAEGELLMMAVSTPRAWTAMASELQALTCGDTGMGELLGHGNGDTRGRGWVRGYLLESIPIPCGSFILGFIHLPRAAEVELWDTGWAWDTGKWLWGCVPGLFRNGEDGGGGAQPWCHQQGHTSMPHDLELGKGRMEMKASQLGVTLNLKDCLASGRG